MYLRYRSAVSYFLGDHLICTTFEQERWKDTQSRTFIVIDTFELQKKMELVALSNCIYFVLFPFRNSKVVVSPELKERKKKSLKWLQCVATMLPQQHFSSLVSVPFLGCRDKCW